MEGVFLNEKVWSTGFTVDNLFKRYSEINSIDLLHSDIQGYELEMLVNAKESFYLTIK